MSETPNRRSLRPKKSINYLEVVQSKPSPLQNGHKLNIPSPFKNEVRVMLPKFDDTLPSASPATSDCDFDPKAVDESSNSSSSSSSSSNSDSEFFSKKKKPKIAPEAKLLQRLAETDDTMDEENEYRMQRQRNMAERLNVLKSMDFEDDVVAVASVLMSSTPAKRGRPEEKSGSSVKRPKAVKEVAVPVRRQPSRRSKNTPQRSVGTDRFFDNSFEPQVGLNDNNTEDEEHHEETFLEVNLDIVKSDEGPKFLEKLQKELDIPYDSVSDFTTCDFDKFRSLVESFTMVKDPVKVIYSRIVSLAFHPSESKLLLLAGDKQGHVCLWDVSENKGVTLQAHQYNVNCVTFSSQDNNKFYTTSLDGTTRKGDINSNSLQLLYSSKHDKLVSKELHTTWHHEVGNTLLIAKGDGVVKLVDMRSSSQHHPSYRCHSRSVRTVQSHPCNENYFLTSSGTGMFGVWDLRNIKSKDPTAVIFEEFEKALISAFYSSTGSYVLTTANDDTIRIYDCRNDQSKLHLQCPHNNHSGRWLSQIKARWQPNREDCFYVASLLTKPKRIQAYDFNGETISELKSTADRYLPVVLVHPSKPIVVGGDASGYINIFSPFKDLCEVC